MAVERPHIPAWAERERMNDLVWIQENLHVLWPTAARCYQEQGRGAIVVETTLTVTNATGAGNPMYYVAETGIQAMNDANALRMVRGYDATWELVTMLLKSEGRVSTYRIGVPSAREVPK